jgi:hypothetical protein
MLIKVVVQFLLIKNCRQMPEYKGKSQIFFLGIVRNIGLIQINHLSAVLDRPRPSEAMGG